MKAIPPQLIQAQQEHKFAVLKYDELIRDFQVLNKNRAMLFNEYYKF